MQDKFPIIVYGEDGKYMLNDKELLLIKVALSHYLATRRKNYRASMVDSDDYNYTVG